MAETSDRDRRFRNKVYVLIAALAIGYFGFKAWHISVAMDVWQAQEVAGDKTGAAR